MQLITAIYIRNFRSITELQIDKPNDVNIFAGINDVGKSNIVKALNLFFSDGDQLDWQTPFKLERDLHQSRQVSGKGQYIEITLSFARPVQTSSENSMATNFWIRRKWTSNGLDEEYNTGSYTLGAKGKELAKNYRRFLTNTNFLYVPAIREQQYFQHLLLRYLLNTIGADATLQNLLGEENKELLKLSAQIKRLTGLETQIEITPDIVSLLQGASILTTLGKKSMPLSMRGDGVQALSIPAMLKLFSLRVSGGKRYLWGFEEPENSLEYRLIHTLADLLISEYSQDTQIFITSHSPVFIALKDNPNVNLYGVDRTSNQTHVTPIVIGGNTVISTQDLVEKMGIVNVLWQVDEKAQQILADHDRIKKELQDAENEILRLTDELDKRSQPVVLVEGPHDRKTLEIAWSKLYPVSPPFEVQELNSSSQLTNFLQYHRFEKNKRMIALYDFEKTTRGEIDKLVKGYDYNYVQNDSARTIVANPAKVIIASTLPIPEKPDRSDCAKHFNLPMEFYFSDEVLLDKVGADLLFTDDRFIDDGDHRMVGKRYVQALVKSNEVTIGQRQLDQNKSGKRKLVEEILPSLPVYEFAAFHPLFQMIVAHLAPDFELPEPAK